MRKLVDVKELSQITCMGCFTPSPSLPSLVVHFVPKLNNHKKFVLNYLWTPLVVYFVSKKKFS